MQHGLSKIARKINQKFLAAENLIENCYLGNKFENNTLHRKKKHQKTMRSLHVFLSTQAEHDQQNN